MDKITVLCPNGHRVTVTMSRHASLSEVLEEVCKKKHFDPKAHVLQHHAKTLDLSLSIHLANLPKNSSLEMVPSEEPVVAGKVSSVNICVQLESGERIMKEFVPDNTLADVFNHVKNEGKVTDQDSDAVQPVIVYLRREFIGLDEFAKNSLQRLGLTQGRAILRLVFRRPESMGQQPGVYNMKEKEVSEEKEEVPWRAMRKNSEMKSGFELGADVIAACKDEAKSVPEESMDAESEDLSTATEIKQKVQDEETIIEPEKAKAVIRTPSPHEPMDADDEEEEEEIMNLIDDDNAVIFKRESGKSLQVKMDKDLDDDFFELTIEDAIRLQANMRKQIRDFNTDAPLMTEAMRIAIKEGEKLSLLNRHPKTVVRVQFPDLMVLQGIFLSGQTIQEVEDFTRRYLLTPDLKFFLLIPPNTRLNPAATLLDSECVPSSLVRLIPENFEVGKDPNTGSYLRSDVLEKLSNTKGAERALREAGVVRMPNREGSPQHENKKAKLEASSSSAKSQPSSSSGAASSSSQTSQVEASKPAKVSSGTVPKWFKPPGQKK